MARNMGSVKTEQKEIPFYYLDLKKRSAPTLHAVDGNNWGNRAYYAMQSRTDIVSKKGEPIFGVVGFISMMKTFMGNIRQCAKGDQYFAMCFDPASTDTWRYAAQRNWVRENKALSKQVFASKSSPLYKGTRDRTKTPDLRPQIDLMRRVLEANGFLVLRKKPYEGDDIVGTLSHMFSPQAFIDMYSVDKDYFQLVVNKRIRLIMQEQANRPAQAWGVKDVASKFGVPPHLIIDFLAMAGDGADNVPGLEGVAEKTAAKLLNEWGSFDELARNIDKIKGKARWKLAIKGEAPCMDMDLQRELVTIDLNVPKLPRDLSAYKRGMQNKGALADLKKELGIDVRI